MNCKCSHSHRGRCKATDKNLQQCSLGQAVIEDFNNQLNSFGSSKRSQKRQKGGI